MNYSMSLSVWGPDYPDPMTFLDTMTTGNAQNNTNGVVKSMIIY